MPRVAIRYRLSKDRYDETLADEDAYLSVEIVTDNPTSGKISIPQLVYVAEQTRLSNIWSHATPVFICQHACVSTLHAN